MTVSDSAHSVEPMAGWQRADDERIGPGLLDAALAAVDTRVLPVSGDRVPVASPDRLGWRGVEDISTMEEPILAFLGRDGDGRALLAAVLSPESDRPATAPAGWETLRTLAPTLMPDEAAAAITAVSLGRWLVDAPFCPACGTRTVLRTAGWSRHCPSCGREHFPRTDPAVIVAITHPDDPDLLLLGSNVAWTDGRYSCFAGFVEAGESLEGAVAREVREEAGIDVVDVRYRGSQPWPYPRSLMVGFLAEAADADAARPDGEEIVSVRWFTRHEIGAALAGEGELLLPGPASIAHRLITGWHAAVTAP